MYINSVPVVLTAVILLLAVAGIGYRFLLQRKNAKKLSINSPNGIAESGFVRIGGIDQWIQIRGEDVSKPILLFLHGGPGVSYVPFAQSFRCWEQHFTVVHWDQRGAGKTFGRNGKRRGEPLTIAQMVEDGIEVAEHLCRRLGKGKVVLFGHSWGSILGVRMAHQRPDLFSFYFGAGQVVNMAESEEDSYRMLTSRLSAEGNVKALKMLEKIGTPPYQNIKAWMIKQRLIVMTAPEPPTGKLPDVMTAALFTPGYSLKDSVDWYRSFSFSLERLYDEMMTRSDARQDASSISIPLCFIQGDQDLQAPLRSIREYVDSLVAPTKDLVILPGEGHTAVLSIPEAFLEQMTERGRIA